VPEGDIAPVDGSAGLEPAPDFPQAMARRLSRFEEQHAGMNRQCESEAYQNDGHRSLLWCDRERLSLFEVRNPRKTALRAM
jgi:hypothetical protein